MKKVLSLIILLVICASSFAQPAAIINEWSQGPSGSKEWVEIVVVQNNLNMHYWKLTDQYTSGGTSTAYIQFSDTMFYHVPAGTIIVVYNGSDIDGALPTPLEDVSWTNDNLVILAHNGTKLTSGGTWPSFNNGTTVPYSVGDSPILKDSTGAIVHDWDQGDNAAFTSIRPVGGATSTKVAYYIGGTAAGVDTAANWTVPAGTITYTTYVTPGAGNGGANTAWIASLRGVATPPAITSVSYAGSTNPAPNTAVTITANVTGTTTPTINLNYRLNGTGFYVSTAMTNTTGTTWTATIPGQTDGTLVDYYVSGSNPGSTTVRYPPSDYHYRVYGTLLTNQKLVVNEVMYNRLSPANHAHDWVELYNNSDATIDLSYFQMMDNTARNYALPAGTTLAGRHYYILPYTNSVFRTDYPTIDTNIIGPSFTYEFSIPSDSVRIYDINGNEINAVGYTSNTPWPAAQTGYSVELVSPDSNNAVGSNWHRAGPLYGTPGVVNSLGDTSAPALASVSATLRTMVVASFNQVLLSTSANFVANYTINSGTVTIDSARQQTNGTDVYLYLNPATLLTSGLADTLVVTNITNTSGLTAGMLTGYFSWTQPPRPSLMITEINYHPSHQFSTNEQQYEWFEVYNTTANAINMNGYHLQVGASDTTISTNLIVNPGCYAVFANNPDSMSIRMGITVQHKYSYAAMSNSTPTKISILNATSAVVDSVTYGFTGGWPTSTNTTGKSLSLTDLNLDNHSAASWAVSTVLMANTDYGTPGLPNGGLNAPGLVSPANGATNQSLNSVTLSWNADTLAATYSVQVATDTGFTVMIFNVSNLTTNSFNDTLLNVNATYYWRVRSAKNSVLSPWSVRRNFTTVNMTISITSPAGGERWMVGFSRNITWTDNGLTFVKGYYSLDSGTTWNTIFTPIANTHSYNWTIPNDTAASCLVMIADSMSDANAVSNYFSIIPAVAPANPTGLAFSYTPASGDVSLSWTAVTGAAGYTVYSATSQTGPWTVLGTSTLAGYIDAGAVNPPTRLVRLYRVTASNQ